MVMAEDALGPEWAIRNALGRKQEIMWDLEDGFTPREIAYYWNLQPWAVLRVIRGEGVTLDLDEQDVDDQPEELRPQAPILAGTVNRILGRPEGTS